MREAHNIEYEDVINEKMYSEQSLNDGPEDLTEASSVEKPIAKATHKKFFDKIERRVLLVIAAVCIVALVVGIILIFNPDTVVKAVGEFLTYTNIVLIAFLLLFTFIS
jgi:hypothetical protein